MNHQLFKLPNREAGCFDRPYDLMRFLAVRLSYAAFVISAAVEELR